MKCENLPGEPPIPGVTIRLIDVTTGALVATTVTDQNGFFQFTDLVPGTYRLEEVQPPDADDSREVVGTVNGVTVGFTGANEGIGTDFIDGIVLKEGDVGVMYCFLEHCKPPESNPAQLSGVIFCDDDLDGVPDATEHRFAGITVTLRNVLTGAVVGTTTTDANGAYAFVDLLPGTYRVEEGAVPATVTENGMVMVVTDGVDYAGTINGVTVGTPGNDLITDIVLKEGDNSVMNNFTEICKPQPATATLSGTVFCDPNDNGILEAGEHRFAGVNIFLVDEATRTVVATTTTDENGFFQFVNEPPGNYRIRRGPVPGTFTENGVLQRTSELRHYAGNVSGTTRGTPILDAIVGLRAISDIVLNAGDNSVNNRFCLSCTPDQILVQ